MTSLAAHFTTPLKSKKQTILASSKIECHIMTQLIIQYSLAVAGCDHVHDLPLDIHPAVATQLGALPQLGPGVLDCGVSLTRSPNDTLRKNSVRKIVVIKKNVSPCSPL